MPYTREERSKAYRDKPTLTMTRIHMDEVQFAQTYGRLRKLIDAMQEEQDIDALRVHIRNAFLFTLAMLDGLNQRITEMQVEEDE